MPFTDLFMEILTAIDRVSLMDIQLTGLQQSCFCTHGEFGHMPLVYPAITRQEGGETHDLTGQFHTNSEELELIHLRWFL